MNPSLMCPAMRTFIYWNFNKLNREQQAAGYVPQMGASDKIMLVCRLPFGHTPEHEHEAYDPRGGTIKFATGITYAESTAR